MSGAGETKVDGKAHKEGDEVRRRGPVLREGDIFGKRAFSDILGGKRKKMDKSEIMTSVWGTSPRGQCTKCAIVLDFFFGPPNTITLE